MREYGLTNDVIGVPPELQAAAAAPSLPAFLTKAVEGAEACNKCFDAMPETSHSRRLVDELIERNVQATPRYAIHIESLRKGLVVPYACSPKDVAA